MTNEELAVRIKNGEVDKIELLWNQVKMYIAKEARKWHLIWEGKNGSTVDDLIQAGYFALLKAIVYYSPDNAKGGSFLTALTFYIHGEFIKIVGGDSDKARSNVLDNAFSLDTPLSDDSEDSFIDLVEDADAVQPFIKVEDEQAHEHLCQILYPRIADLTPQQQEIVYMYFWLNMTYAEIGRQYGVSRQRVHQMIEKTLNKLRSTLSRETPEDYYTTP